MSARRFVSELVHPQRTARAIPFGRLAIAAVFAFVVLFVAFTLRSEGVELPFLSHPYTLSAWFDDADGLDPANGPPVSVAGVPEGEVTGVRYEGGRALVTMQLSGSARGRVFRDATVRVRPFNAANFLEVDIQPGTPAAGALPAGDTIAPTRTSIPVSTDQVLDILDADTSAYLQILTEQGAIALHGAGGQLGQALARLSPLSSEAKAIGGMLAQRRSLISQLVGETDTIFSTLARRHAELASVVGSASRVLAITAAHTAQLRTAVARLPAVLTEGASAGRQVSATAQLLRTALERIAPGARAFGAGLRATTTAVPALQGFLSALRSLAHRTLTPSRRLRSVVGGLSHGLGAAIAGYRDFESIIRVIAQHAAEIRRTSDTLSGVFSTQDAYGPLARVKLEGIEPPTAADLGLSPSAAIRERGGYSRLDAMLAVALRALCRRQPLGCVLAAGTPGLPSSIVPARDGVAPRLERGAR